MPAVGSSSVEDSLIGLSSGAVHMVEAALGDFFSLEADKDDLIDHQGDGKDDLMDHQGDDTLLNDIILLSPLKNSHLVIPGLFNHPQKSPLQGCKSKTSMSSICNTFEYPEESPAKNSNITPLKRFRKRSNVQYNEYEPSGDFSPCDSSKGFEPSSEVSSSSDEEEPETDKDKKASSAKKTLTFSVAEVDKVPDVAPSKALDTVPAAVTEGSETKMSSVTEGSEEQVPRNSKIDLKINRN